MLSEVLDELSVHCGARGQKFCPRLKSLLSESRDRLKKSVLPDFAWTLCARSVLKLIFLHWLNQSDNPESGTN